MVDGLGNEQPVKGISVMQFQVADLDGVGKGNRSRHVFLEIFEGFVKVIGEQQDKGAF